MRIPPGFGNLPGLLRAVTLFAWAGLFIGFDVTGRLPYFLAPGFRPLVMVAGVILALLGLTMLLFGSGTSCCAGHEGQGAAEGCNHHGEHLSAGQLATSICLMALLAGTAFAAPRGFSASAVINRMGGGDPSRGIPPPSLRAALDRAKEGEAPLAAIEPPLPGLADGGESGPDSFDPRSFFARDQSGKIEADLTDLWAAAADPVLRKFLTDQNIIVRGQFLKLSDSAVARPGAPRYKIIRLMVTCCAADARPISIPVFAEALPDVVEMDWIEIEGRLVLKVEGGEHIPYLEAHSVKRSEEPAEVFLFN